MLMADVHVHQLRREVEVPATLLVPEPAPSAPATTTGESDPWADQEWKTWARSFVNVVLWAVSRAVMESH